MTYDVMQAGAKGVTYGRYGICGRCGEFMAHYVV